MGLAHADSWDTGPRDHDSIQPAIWKGAAISLSIDLAKTYRHGRYLARFYPPADAAAAVYALPIVVRTQNMARQVVLESAPIAWRNASLCCAGLRAVHVVLLGSRFPVDCDSILLRAKRTDEHVQLGWHCASRVRLIAPSAVVSSSSH